MKYLEAVEIIKNINNKNYTNEQKGLAIHTAIIQFNYHNGITKEDFLNCIKFLFPLAFNVEE